MDEDETPHRYAAMRAFQAMMSMGDRVGHDVILSAVRAYQAFVDHQMNTDPEFRAAFQAAYQKSIDIGGEVLAIALEQQGDGTVGVEHVGLGDGEEDVLALPAPEEQGDKWKSN